MRRARADAGFLLAETLITFALSALVLVGLVSSAAVLLRATDRSVAAVGSTDALGRTLAALRRDVSQLKRARWAGDEPQAYVFRGGPNSLFFAQEVPSADGGRELQVVALREIEAARGTVLTRAETHLSARAGGWADLTFGAQRVVPTGAARLRFRYVAEAVPENPAPKPVDAWASGPTLPAFVIVEAVDAASTRLMVSDRIAIRADAEIGCADKRPPRRDDSALPGSQTGAQQGAAQPPQQGAEQPPQAASSQPTQAGAPPNPGTPGSELSLDDSSGTANKNEFCGRADKGVAPKQNEAGVPQSGLAARSAL